jgi:hypothetical protein
MSRRALAAFVCVVLATPMVATSLGGTSSAAPVCDPMQTTPVFGGAVPTGREVLGFDIGQKEVTSAESDRYLEAVDPSSDRVVTGTLGHSVQNRPLKYAIVSSPQNVAARTDIAADMQALRDPATSAPEALQIVEGSPNILWIASNVHGGEESGTDASLRVFYELADRTDCAATQILENSLVVLLPIQNPDGREAEERRNFFGFDMNRDWFARTQPETDAKIELLRQYPPVLFVDDHEMGTKTYFFPPNSDPVYHEITNESIDWINNIYGASLAAEFERQRIPYFNRSIYDLFYMGYRDPVPSTGFISAGMTFEKHSQDPIHVRTYEQYVTQWVSLSQGAINRERLLTEWRSAWIEAHQQGVDGVLKPNEVINEGNEIATQVPTDPLRHYFIRSDDPDKQQEVSSLVGRLQRMDVDVYRLTEPLAVEDFKPYGRPRRSEILPVGTYWIPMARMQKHWIQAMLHEDGYTPFPYFYDVTGWSNPLLFNVAGGSSGAELVPAATEVGPVEEPAWPAPPGPVPDIAVWNISSSTTTLESAGWLRYVLERVWHLPYQMITSDQISKGALASYDGCPLPTDPPTRRTRRSRTRATTRWRLG